MFVNVEVSCHYLLIATHSCSDNTLTACTCRLQDQLRRLKKVEEKAKKKAVKPRKEKPLTTINVSTLLLHVHVHVQYI